VGTEVEEISEVSTAKLRAYLEKNPVGAWTGAGKTGERRPYFAYDAGARMFSYQGPTCTDVEALRTAVNDRVAVRLVEYFVLRFERKNVFNVINAGDDRGIINLGNDEAAPIPRNGGWKQVIINGNQMWAKFAKIAINVLKQRPEDSPTLPNRLTQELEAMFGPGGYLPGRGNRVAIVPVAGRADMWEITPYRLAK
jgi:hypothetical protein